MLKISRVDIVDGQTLDIELNNGHLILLDTHNLFKIDNRYKGLSELEILSRPNTDGESIFWKNGPKITLEEVLRLLLI